MLRLTTVSFLLITIAAAATVSCGSPCRDLSEKVCYCEATESLQQNCLRRVDNVSDNNTPSEQQEAVCQGILDAETCTCDELAVGQLSGCGLSL